MKHLALLLIAVFACKSDRPPAPAPTPTESGSGSGSGSGSTVIARGSGTGVGSAGVGSGSAACVIKVELSATNVAWDGGGVKGQTDFKAGERPHLDALQGLSNCSAWLVADDEMIYQDVIAVMDTLFKMGIVNVSLGDPTKMKPKTKIPTPGVTTKPLPGADGKPITGTITDFENNPNLHGAPLLIITKTEVRFHEKVVGKPDDDAIVEKVEAVLPKNPDDPTLILQADEKTSAKTINRVITATSNLGYTNVLFAVKNL